MRMKADGWEYSKLHGLRRRRHNLGAWRDASEVEGECSRLAGRGPLCKLLRVEVETGVPRYLPTNPTTYHTSLAPRNLLLLEPRLQHGAQMGATGGRHTLLDGYTMGNNALASARVRWS